MTWIFFSQKTYFNPPPPTSHGTIVFSKCDLKIKVQHNERKKESITVTRCVFRSGCVRHCKKTKKTKKLMERKEKKKQHQTKLHDSHSHLFKILFTSLNSSYNSNSPTSPPPHPSTPPLHPSLPTLLSKLATRSYWIILTLAVLPDEDHLPRGCMAHILKSESDSY